MGQATGYVGGKSNEKRRRGFVNIASTACHTLSDQDAMSGV
jgi:hypothetical protein